MTDAGNIPATRYERIVRLWQQKQIATDAELSEALNAHSIAFVYHSGKIENEHVTYHDTREIFERDIVTAYTGDLRTLFEIRGAKDAYELFLTAFGASRSLDENLIQELQGCLVRNTYDERSGEYKRNDYRAGRNAVGVLPEDVPEEMQKLLGGLQELENRDALSAAAYFHAKFENIHPFADGNGRIGRLAMNYFLVLHSHPPVIIHEEDRQEYDRALEVWDTALDLLPIHDFLRWQTEKTWEKQMQRIEKRNSCPGQGEKCLSRKKLRSFLVVC